MIQLTLVLSQIDDQYIYVETTFFISIQPPNIANIFLFNTHNLVAGSTQLNLVSS